MNKKNNTPKILVVEDDLNICNLITRFFKNQNYQMESANDGTTALEIFPSFLPDLVILDINLPDMLGYDLCEKMQKINNAFILILTSRNDITDKKKGFKKGADDFLTKPFNIEELAFRIEAILKRKRVIESIADKILTINDLTIDTDKREVRIKDQIVSFTALEFNLLHFLAKTPNKVWERKALIENVWKDNSLKDYRVVDVHIGQIRKKIEPKADEPSYIITVRGSGYKFQNTDK